MVMSAGDSAARRGLTACFRENQALVHGVVFDRCGDPVMAEEITAQTFEAAARQFARGRGGEVTPSWLTVVAKRRLVDHWRHVAATSRAVERLAGAQPRWHEPCPASDDSDISLALESLPARQRTVLVLRYFDDWGLDEIADGLGISYRAVESLLARARRSFAAALDRRPISALDDDGSNPWSRRTR
jgi:RNA polymerase sigma factor (sigma-70 family)